MGTKEGFGEQGDPLVEGRRDALRNAVATLEYFARGHYGEALVRVEGSAVAATTTMNVETSALAQMAAEQSMANMAAITTPNVVRMPIQGAEDVRAA